MRAREIVAIIVMSLAGLWFLWFIIYSLIIEYKEVKTRKKSQTQKITELENEIKVIKFKLDNPSGFKLRQGYFLGWDLEYIKSNNIKSIELPYADDYKFKRNYIVDDKGNKYKFDINSEILIKIEKEK